MTARRRLAVAVVAVLLWSCAEQKDSSVEAARSYIREVGGEDVKDAGRLQVSTTDVQTDGRIAKIRGGVQNTFDQQVEGIRYVVTIYENGPAAKVLDRWQHEADTTIEPGDRAPMRLDVESMYLLASGGRFTILAVPVKLGGQPVPPPDGWR